MTWYRRLCIYSRVFYSASELNTKSLISYWYLQAYNPACILREQSPVKPPLFHFIGEVVNFFSKKKNDPVWANELYRVKKLYPNVIPTNFLSSKNPYQNKKN